VGSALKKILRILLAMVPLGMGIQAAMAETVALELPPDLQFNCTAFDAAGAKHLLSGRVTYRSATEAGITFVVNSALATPESAAQPRSVTNERATVQADGSLHLITRAPVSDERRTPYMHYDFYFEQRSKLRNGYVAIRKTIEPRPNVLVFHLYTATGLCDLKEMKKSK
jgi:hypothetical protein